MNPNPPFNGLLAPRHPVPLTDPSEIERLEAPTKIETEPKPNAGKVEAVTIVRKETTPLWEFVKQTPWGDIRTDELHKPGY